MNVELRHLRALAAIGDEGSITGAAAVLRVSQPALSRTLEQLEQRMGAQLVERTTRRLALTPAGLRLSEHAHRILTQLDDALAEVAAGPRPLRVGFAWAALGAYTVRLLRDWRFDRPDVPLQVHRLDDPGAALRRGEIDVAFLRALPQDDRGGPELAVLPLYSEPRIAALCEDDPLAARDEVALGDLADRTVVLCATAATTSAALWPARRRPAATFEVANVDEWLTAIATGEAVGVTAQATRHSHPHPGVRYLPLTDAAPVTVHFLAPATPTHPATEAFRRHAHSSLPTGAGG
ncbi:LysR family transcriptional regulator [Streptomyces sp. NBC_01565]|uniref:LysR substrate-binding domain-containing protein n=1 Tax=unclassified Streptomyces TaxID=2593676 RepID=UPI0022562D4C|nr:LysR family transcriptional regulator [Streptomyces sp. NBC_01565]MCX4545732.1 LysR family transcriptional regulator [Streptomyces sp. NBC_01565]